MGVQRVGDVLQRGVALALFFVPCIALAAPPSAEPATVSAADEAVELNACVPYGSECTSDDNCCDEAGLNGICNQFGNNKRCTFACPSDPDECPNDGRGCNNKTPAMCKTPK